MSRRCFAKRSRGERACYCGIFSLCCNILGLRGSAKGRYSPNPSQTSTHPVYREPSPPDFEMQNHDMNGLSNGTAFMPESRSPSIQVSEGSASMINFTKDQQVTVLRETVVTMCQRLVANIGEIEDSHAESLTIEEFLDYIERQRLTHMPHRGSHWDKVLKWAEYFALQVSGYANAVAGFVSEAGRAARLIWSASQALLEIGPDNAAALEITFGVFYHIGLSISLLLRQSSLLAASSHIRLEVGQVFSDLLTLVSDVSITYRVKVYGPRRETNFDFYDAFGNQVTTLHQRKNHIVDAMWQYSLGDKASMDVRTIRKWLCPRDRNLQKLQKTDDLAPGIRYEYTCEWFQSHLLQFSRSKEDTLMLHAPAGSGKSVLAKWVIERLQRPLGKKSYLTLSCTIESDIHSEATPLAVIKRLLSQISESTVGDQTFFNRLAESYGEAMSKDTKRLESSLWDCLSLGIKHRRDKDKVMIIVDGLDEIRGSGNVQQICNKLGSLAYHCPTVQVVATTRDPNLKSAEGKTNQFQVSPDHTHEDLRRFIDHQLDNSTVVQQMSEHAREHQVERILHVAKGNFLWAHYTTVNLGKETSKEKFENSVATIKEKPKSLDDLISRSISGLDFSNSDTNLLASLMLASERPLTVTELKCLLQIDLQKKHSVDRKSDMASDILAALGPLVKIERDCVRFFHPRVRSKFIEVLDEGKGLRGRKAIQTELLMRLLAYCNSSLHGTQDLSMEMITKTEVDRILGKHALLEYAVRMWTVHFRASSLCHDNGGFQLSEDFRAIFPESTQLAMLEWACWGSETSRFEVAETHQLSLRVRESVFTAKHASVLQSLVVCGNVWRETNHTTEAANYYYRASVVGQQILSKYHSITEACSNAFLDITQTMTTTTRTELVTGKEQILTFVIEMYRYQHGKTHDLVIRHYKILAQLYIAIHEEHKAETIWRELREIMIVRFGKGSEEETSISENLTIIIKKGSKKIDVDEYEKGIFDIVAELEVWNIRRIQLTLELAHSYETRGEFLMAEELYIFLWRKLTERCHFSGHHHGVDIHLHLIEVVIEYVRFLRRCHRHEEASSVLICVWTEYEEYEFESETLLLKFKVIGELMRAVSLFSVAVSVFKRCCSWFKARNIVEHASSCEILISETMEEIINTTTSTSVSSTTVTTTETIIKETFESSLSRTTVDSETISTCKALISLYMKMERWSEAIEVTKRSLLLIWKSVVHGGGTIALPRDFGADAIDVAINLAICHHRCQHFHEAEEIYIRIYRACRNSCRIDDERMAKAFTVLIEFYEEHRHWHKVIEIYQGVLAEYRAHLGAKHNLTIRTLYILGGLCAEHGHGHAHEYYEEIIVVLDDGSHVCHVDALDAMFHLCRYRYESGHWHKLQTVCKILWKTWIGQHHGYERFTADFVEVLYQRYRYVLEYHIHCEYSTLRDLTIEYRNTCVKTFGMTAALTIKAMIELAHICMRSEKYIHEAISTYEQVLTQIKTTKTTVISTRVITTIKTQLTEAYISVCHYESVSNAVVERAIKVMIEQYEHLRITLGWTHTETLVVLREIILIQLKLNKEESRTIVMRMLLEATLNIIISTKQSILLHEAGKTVGHIFVTCGMTNLALEIIDEIRLQIITGSPSASNKHGIKFEKAVDKVSFVFLVTVEQTIRGEMSISYAQVMADYITESVLYESYTRSVKTSHASTIGHAARLRDFLGHKHRHALRETVENQSYDVFVKTYKFQPRSRKVGLMFYIAMLTQIGDSVREVNMGSLACASSIVEVRSLLQRSQVHEACEVAECALAFITDRKAYHQLENIPHGFKLAALVAGRGVDRSIINKIDTKPREHMLEISRSITGGVLQACKDSKIDFLRLQLRELNDLIGLLGEQHNYKDLEWILDLLWKSREVQKKWAPSTIIAVGTRFVQARYLHTSPDRRSDAIRLCEDICYNLRRVRGSLDPKTLEMSDLLSQLYTNMGHTREAQGVHENILRLIVEGDDGDDRTIDTLDSDAAYEQVQLLKQTYLRLKGWDKPLEVYNDLITDLKSLPAYSTQKQWKELSLPKTWSHQKESPSETLGKFFPPREWELVKPENVTEKGDALREESVPRRAGQRAMKRATSNWGLGLVHRFLHGGDDGGQEEGMSNGKGGEGGEMNGKGGEVKMNGSSNGVMNTRSNGVVRGKKMVGMGGGLGHENGYESALEEAR